MVSSKLAEKLDIIDQVNAELGFDPYDPEVDLEDHIYQLLHYADGVCDDLRLSIAEQSGMYKNNGRIVKRLTIRNLELMLCIMQLTLIRMLVMVNAKQESDERKFDSKLNEIERTVQFLKINFISNTECIEALGDRIHFLTLKIEYIDKILKIYEKESITYPKPRVLAKEIS